MAEISCSTISVLGNIVEKSIGDNGGSQECSSSTIGSLDKSSSTKRSKFYRDSEAQKNFRALNKCENGAKNDDKSLKSGDVSSLKKIISNENDIKLSEMTESEIIEEKNRLLARMDRKLVAFLQNRHKTPEETDVDKELEMPPEDTVDIDKTVLTDLPFEVDPDWLHMNIIESNKLDWMRSPYNNNKTSNIPGNITQCSTARFDFHGCLCMPNAMNLPVELYQHGDAPQDAGYTLSELMPLCRSAAPNQRLLALRTVSRIIAKAKSGLFDDVISPPLILTTIKDSALCTVIRVGLDENSGQLCSAHVHLMASLLHNHYDELILDRTFTWPTGVILPLMNPQEDGEDDINEDEDNTNNQHEKLCSKDVIKGFLEMDVLTRIRYILDVLQPQSPQFIVDVFNILISMARHSQIACAKVLLCPGLMDCVFKYFLPNTWLHPNDPSVFPIYGIPFYGAIKLVRIICCANKTNANTFISKYEIGEKLVHYLLLEPESSKLPPQFGCELILESYRLLTVLVAYGLCTNIFSDLFIELQRQLQLLLTLPTETLRSGKRDFVYDRAASILHAISICINAAKFKISSTSFDKSTVYESIKGLLQCAKLILNQLLIIFNTDPTISENESYSNLLSCTLLAFAAYFTRQDCTTEMEFDLSSHITALQPFLKIQAQKMIQSTSDSEGFSILCWESEERGGVNIRDADCLPSLLCITHSAKSFQPPIRSASPLQFLTCYMQLIRSMKNDGNLLLTMLEPYLRKYIEVKTGDYSHANHFARFESVLLFNVVKLMDTEATEVLHPICLPLMLKLVTDLQGGQLGLSVHLLSRSCSLLAEAVAPFCSTNVLLQRACDSMDLIKSTLLKTGQDWASKIVLAQSLDIVCGQVEKSSELKGPRSLCLEQGNNRICSSLVAFQPIHSIYVAMQAMKKCGRTLGAANLEQQENVVASVMYFYTMHKACPKFVEKNYGMESVYCRICEIFLLGNDYYMHEGIREYMQSILVDYILAESGKGLYFTDDTCITGLNSFAPFYDLLLGDFQWNSYGDNLFAQFVVLPSLCSRKLYLLTKLWGEELGAIRAVTLTNSQLKDFPSNLTDFDVYEECGREAVICVARAVMNKVVHPIRNEAVYNLAIKWLRKFANKIVEDLEDKQLQLSVKNNLVL